MKNSEIFYFDVDGTLLDNKSHTIPESTIEALKQLKAAGYKIALCTGRSLSGAYEVGVVDMMPWDGFVLANGSQILDASLNTIKETPLPIAWLHDLLKVHDGPFLMEGDTLFLSSEPNQRLVDSFAHFHIDTYYPVQAYNDEKIFNLMSYAFDTIPEAIREDMFKDTITVLDQLGNTEIMSIESGKHNGIQHLNKHLKTTRYTMFGDGENDMDALAGATYSVAMGNAVAHVQEKAKYVTKPVNEDGIYHALKAHDVI
ncbi:HAD-IIB family hydrolase [Erysipelothrix aquatica]|uniref:HAD-IIB family hydrolase n=1 Tax=Erysipelothrix aquatica TaxID=2683714 RepID=UPI00135B1502|nr:HAD-IIB family hydrolase [Erysipelothrix aquatica]